MSIEHGFIFLGTIFFSQLKVFLNSLCNLSYASVFEPPTSISQVLDYNYVAQTFDLNFFPMFSNLLSFPVFPSTLRKPFIFFYFYLFIICAYIGASMPWCHVEVRVQLKWVYSLSFPPWSWRYFGSISLVANAFLCWARLPASFFPGIFCVLLVAKTLVPTTLKLLESVSDLSVLVYFLWIKVNTFSSNCS